METDTIALIAVVAFALIFDFFNGLQDGCNAVSTVIYTKALRPHFAIAISALFNFIGPLVVGVAVAKTIGGIINAEVATAHLVIAALLGATVWEVLTWFWALPVSCSHALVGALVGAGVAAVGLEGINWGTLILVFVALLTSPIVGIATGYLLMRASRFAFSKLRMSMASADRIYKRLQILSSAWVAFSHGSNDATKVMGIIVVFLAAEQGLNVDDYVAQNGFPIWVILACAGAMAAGTYVSVLSFRLIRTLGEKITKLHPINGFSAECGGAAVIQLASIFGMPVSTTHVITSAVTGTGLASKLGGVSWKVFRAIMLAWVVTLPFCAIVAAGFYYRLTVLLLGAQMAKSRLKHIRRTLGGETTLEGAIDAMGKEREEQVLERLVEFADQVVVIVTKLKDMVDRFAADRYEELAEAAEELDRLESQADHTKEAILDRLCLGGVFPMHSSDLARLVGSMDSIANLAAGAADRISMRKFSLSPEMNEQLVKMAQVDLEATQVLRDAVVAMGSDLQEAIRLAGRVDRIESQADKIFAEIYRGMFDMDTDFKTFHQLKAIIERLESIADRCMQNGELLRHMALEYIENE